MKKLLLFTVSSAVALLTFVVGFCQPVKADETTSEKIQNHTDETEKDLKKGGRTIKRELRDATGNHSTSKDIKDKVDDTTDDIKTKAKKLKRKAD